jgi:hypothetical protein
MSDGPETFHLLAAAPVHASWPEEEDRTPFDLPFLGSLLWGRRFAPEEGP